MKKWTTLTLIAFGMMAQAQTLEHSYPSGTTYSKVSPTEVVFTNYDPSSKQLSVYNASHSIIATITANISETDGTAQLAARTLFDGDIGFEFIVRSNSANKAYLIDDDGSVKFTFNGIVSFLPINTASGAKLLGYALTGGVAVYSLPGTVYANLSENQTTENDVVLYPNPAGNQLRILATTSGTGTIIDASGRVVMVVDVAEGDTTLNTEALPSGAYSIILNGSTYKFVK